MSKHDPDHHDAELVLRVYEIRRESLMRASRDAINGQFWPKSYEDVQAIAKPDHPMNAAWRQVASYWEMVYGFAKRGVVHAEFWVENCGEGMFLFAKIAPYLEQLRRDSSPASFQNTEWAATETEAGKRYLGYLQERVKQMLESK